MKKNIFLFSFIVLSFIVIHNLKGQTRKVFINLGGIVEHSLPKSNELTFLGYSHAKAKTLFLSPGFEMLAGIKLTNRLDICTGISSGIKHLYSSGNYELNIKTVSYPILLRYHLSRDDSFSNVILFGVCFGKIVQNQLLMDSSARWEYRSLLDLNNTNPISIRLGIGRLCKINERSFFSIEPFVNYELSNNNMLNEYFKSLSFGIKTSYEFN